MSCVIAFTSPDSGPFHSHQQVTLSYRLPVSGQDSQRIPWSRRFLLPSETGLQSSPWVAAKGWDSHKAPQAPKGPWLILLSLLTPGPPAVQAEMRDVAEIYSKYLNF